MKAKRSIYNILFGILNQAIMIAAGIVLPRLVLINLGSEANGLLNSVNQIFTYFALLEAGVGTATLQALYAPVGDNDRGRINQILAATSQYYKRTGVLYLLAFLALACIYPFVVKSVLERPVIFVVIVLTGFSGVISYFFQGKYNILLLAEGKNYINSNLSTVTYILTSVAKIALLLCGYNVVALQTMYCFFNIVKMIYIEWYTHKNYKWIDLRVKPDYQSIEKKNYVLIHQVSSLIFNNTDAIILTLTVGLKSVSVYTMYTLLFGMISTLIGTLSGSVQFVLGQAFHQDREYYKQLHDAYEVVSMSTVFSLYCIANIFILPFMALYTKGVSDINYIDVYLPYLFIAVYLLNNGRESSNIVIKLAGHFQQTVGRSLFEAILNVTVSLLGVWKFGIYGVLLGTIAALLYRANDMIFYANQKILLRSPRITYRRWIRNLILFILITIILNNLSIQLLTYGEIIFWAVIACIIIIPFFFLINGLMEPKVSRFVWSILKSHIVGLQNNGENKQSL